MPSTASHHVPVAEAERPPRVTGRPQVIVQGILHHAPVEVPQPADCVAPDALRIAAAPQEVSQAGCVGHSRLA